MQDVWLAVLLQLASVSGRRDSDGVLQCTHEEVPVVVDGAAERALGGKRDPG